MGELTTVLVFAVVPVSGGYRAVLTLGTSVFPLTDILETPEMCASALATQVFGAVWDTTLWGE